MPLVRRCASLITVALLMSACGGGTVPPSPTSASPLTATTTMSPTADPVVPSGPIAPAPRVAAGTIASLAVEPARIRGGETPVATVTLVAPAPTGGTVVTLTSSDRDVRPPATITIPAGQTIGMFQIPTSEPHADTDVRLTAVTTDGNATADIVLVLPAPGARTDEYTMTMGATLSIAAPGILDNDARRSGHDLAATLVMGPMQGTLSLNANGGFTYRPNAGFAGSDRFIYRAMDGTTASNEAHVWIAVAAPIAGSAPAPAPTGSQTFAFTGGSQTFTVPDGVTALTVEASGAQGGNGSVSTGTMGIGGQGGTTTATIAVTPGEILTVTVAGAGGNGTTLAAGTAGFNGGAAGGIGGGLTLGAGGGGGASDVRRGSTLADRLVVAGGGGGAGGETGGGIGGAGGAGGGTTGGGGGNGSSGLIGGDGGSNVAGGSGGTGTLGTPDGTAGGLGVGGVGTNGLASSGGGGGGYYGGGSGEAGFPVGVSGPGGGGGGGSSFAVAGATSVTHQQGVRSGNGQVVIRW